MKTLIILNGECENKEFLKKKASDFDRIICADGGYLHAVSTNITVDVVVGDFDSSEKPSGVECVLFPKDKDLSDAEIAIEYALEHYGDDITLTCSLGKRLDHQLFNVFLLAKYPFVSIEENDVIAFFCKSCESFSEYVGKTISFLPISTANITLENFKYEIFDCDITLGETVTLSNIALNKAAIKVNSGKVIAIINKTEN